MSRTLRKNECQEGVYIPFFCVKNIKAGIIVVLTFVGLCRMPQLTTTAAGRALGCDARQNEADGLRSAHGHCVGCMRTASAYVGALEGH